MSRETIYDDFADVVVDGKTEYRARFYLVKQRHFQDAGGQRVEGIPSLHATLSGVDESGANLDGWKLMNEAKKITIVMDDGKELDVFVSSTDAMRPGSDLELGVSSNLRERSGNVGS